MRSSPFVLAWTVLALAWAAPAGAQEQRPPQRQAVGEVGGPLIAKETLDKLNLTADQQAKVDKILKEFNEKGQDLELKAGEALKKARADMDRAAAQQAFQQMGEARKARENYLGQVLALLTDEQKQLVQRPRTSAGVRDAAPAAGAFLPPALQERLGLSADQKAKLTQLQKEFESKALQVLTEEQRQKYEQMKKGRRPDQEQPRKRPGAESRRQVRPTAARIEALN